MKPTQKLLKKNKKELIHHISNLRMTIKHLSNILYKQKTILKRQQTKINYIKARNTYLESLISTKNKCRITYTKMKTKGKFYRNYQRNSQKYKKKGKTK